MSTQRWDTLESHFQEYEVNSDSDLTAHQSLYWKLCWSCQKRGNPISSLELTCLDSTFIVYAENTANYTLHVPPICCIDMLVKHEQALFFSIEMYMIVALKHGSTHMFVIDR